jgi:hypothetical protein
MIKYRLPYVREEYFLPSRQHGEPDRVIPHGRGSLIFLHFTRLMVER